MHYLYLTKFLHHSMIDTHCHLTYPGLFEIKEKVIEECKKRMDAVITCGYPKDAKDALQLSKKYEGFLFVTLGLHPVDIVKMTDSQIKDYLDLIASNADEIVAIGEIGLDKHWFPDEKTTEKLKKIFEQCLDLSEQMDLPIVLHTRKAEQECFDIVKERGMKRVYFHSYTSNLTLAKEIIDSDFIIGLTTSINRSKNTKKIAQRFPLDKLFTETDSPFLAPNPGETNYPYNVEFILDTMSQLRKMEKEKIDGVIMKTARDFFKL